MSSDVQPVPPKTVGEPLDPKEIGALLIRHYGLKEGKYALQIEFQIGAGTVGPDKESLLPGMMFGIRRIGLVEAPEAGPLVIDASEVYQKHVAAKRRVRSTGV